MLQFFSPLNLKELASGVLRLPGCHGSWQVSQRLPLPPTWAPGILATERKEKKKKTAPVLLYNSLQLWETKQRKQQTQQPWGHFPLLTLTWWLRAWTLIPDRLEYIQALYDLCDPGQVA